ncbi:hypothetical protein AVEN_68320-1 [Araneus ventricosus]|uniref:Uncharacterized protein n=1 Tax=Araneus ventricosus TaxID=182803 RepID=A0A4Y2P5J4_ARAVE|nr:hypothetical protein AVEN_68320-1 [Araneus ventricosus]
MACSTITYTLVAQSSVVLTSRFEPTRGLFGDGPRVVLRKYGWFPLCVVDFERVVPYVWEKREDEDLVRLFIDISIGIFKDATGSPVPVFHDLPAAI